MNIKEQFKEGLFSNNPVLVQLIGLCSVLAISVTVQGAIGMGFSVIIVLTLSNVFISALRNFIPDEVRIPAFIVVIASFVTLLQMAMQAFLPDIYNLLGIFLPLIVVNCIILGRAEAFASKNGVLASFIDGIANGTGYLMTITIIAVIREFLGTGAILGNQILPEGISLPFFTQSPAAFIVLGCVIATSIKLKERNKQKRLGR